MEKQKRKGLKWLSILWILPLVLVLALGVLMYVVPLFETSSCRAVENSADWMARLPDDKYLSEVVLPGTHDSATQYVDLAFFSKCQEYDISEQLEAGFRYLDIRLGEKDGRLALMHGFTLCRKGGLPWSEPLYYEDVLEDCRAFLDEHPTETVVFAVKHEHGEASDEEFANLAEDGLKALGDRFLDADSLPTVGEARGKLVLMRRYGTAADSFAGIPMQWQDQGGYNDVSLDTESTYTNGYTLRVQDRYEYGTENKWRAFTDGMDKAQPDAASVALNFLSTKGSAKYGHPYHFAKELNDRLYEHDPDKLHGWIIVDFGNAALAGNIWMVNFL